MAIASRREPKRNLMRHLLTFDPVSVDEVQLKETEIGSVPEHREVSPLSQTVVLTQYGLSMRGAESRECPILRMNNLRNGSPVPANLQYVDLSPAEKGKFRLNEGDLLFKRTDGADLVGRTALFHLPETLSLPRISPALL